MAARYNTETIIRMLDSSFEDEDVGSDDGWSADRDQAGVEEIDDDGWSTTVVGTSEPVEEMSTDRHQAGEEIDDDGGSKTVVRSSEPVEEMSADRDLAGVEEIDDNGESTTVVRSSEPVEGMNADRDLAGVEGGGSFTAVVSSSEPFDGSDSENDSSFEGNEDSEENVDFNENEADQESCSSESEREQEPTTIKTRKRTREPWAWKRTKSSRLRNSGKSYTSTAGKKVPARVMDDTPCNCRRQCYSKVPLEQRKKLFDGFWVSGSFNVQNAYLCGCVKTSEVARRYTSRGSDSRRSYSRLYYVQSGAVSTRVCKEAFLRIHGVLNGRVNRALQAQHQIGGSPPSDRRGKHEPKNKTKKDNLGFAKAHIDSFPKYKSHYSRADNPHKHFLSPNLSIEKMYRLYKQKCQDESKPVVSAWVYRRTFNECFNLSFGNPKSDTCKVCDGMKIAVAAESDLAKKELLKLEWELHKVKAGRGYQSLKEDAAFAKLHSDTEMLTFDLEKSLPTPVLTTGIVYYKRQLWTYNIGIHNTATEVGCMHMWNESVASRGSQEVGSCLLSHIQEMRTSATKLTVYSDACGGQNRNINMVCMWMHVVASDDYPFTSVDHKFMVSGHSYLPNDRDFGSIETASKKSQCIYVPADWERVVKESRHKNPFSVTRMERKDFLSFQPLKQAIVNRKVNITGAKVGWLNIKWINVCKDLPLQYRYRHSHSELEAWKTVSVKRAAKGRPPDLGKIKLPYLYVTPRRIKKAKLDDLMELLIYVPPIHHGFFQHLVGTGDSEFEAEESESEGEED